MSQAPSPSVHPIILCGGAGTRLWPESTPRRPKAFLPLTSTRSLLQETALRIAGVAGAADPIVVASYAHAEIVLAEFAQINIACRLVTEPAGRGSAPAIALACLEIVAQDPDGLAVAVACDHHVPDAAAFAAGVLAALPAAAKGAIATFGVRPTHASTAYGYIRPGELFAGEVRAAASFIEKPDAELAEVLLAEGCLWNSGNFVFHAATMIEELEAREPDVMAAARAAHAALDRDAAVLALGDAFLASPDIAIDVAVMERTDRAAVLPIDYAWSDLGAWDSVHEAATKDKFGNSVRGRVSLVDSERCLVRTDAATRVAVIGLENVAVIVENGAVLVCDMAHAQKVRKAAKSLEGV
ncbi:MAG: sugar phosphate nucleotidyltransferase [Caulobacteraceae bacterium]